MAKRKAAAKKGVLKEKTEDVAKNGSESDSVVQKVEEKEPENNVNESETSEDDTKVEVPVRAKGKTGRGRQAKGVSKATPKAVKKGNKRGKITTSVPSPAKKAKPEPVPEKSEAEDDKDYEVGKILGVRFPKIGKREFSIQWKGYSVKEATWEPEENLDCEDLVKEFMAKHEEGNLPRSRRMSSRPNTIRSTRMSETRDLTRVIAGRVTKASVSSNVQSKSISVLEEFKRLNGEAHLRNNSNVNGNIVNRVSSTNKDLKERKSNEFERSRGGRSLKRAALLTSGMAISVGAALLLSSSSTINWDGIQENVYQIIQNCRHQLVAAAAALSFTTQQTVQHGTQ